MKKIISSVIFSAILLAYGCSSGDKDKKVEQPTNAVQDSNEPATEKLEVIKQYEGEIGEIEAYYINDKLEQSTGEQDIDLTINYVEYGKVFVDKTYRSTYENLADEEGKNTYIKIGLEITGDASQFAKHTFYADQSSIKMEGIRDTAADSTFSDDVAISSDMKSPPISGYLYFLIDHEMPINEFQLIAPAPFSNENSLSITDNYVFDIKLK